MDFWLDDEKKFKQLINILRDPMEKDDKLKEHTHDFLEIEYVLFGSGVQIINGKEYKVKRGDLIFLKKGDYHTYKTDSHLEILNVVFHYSVFLEICDTLYMYTTNIDFPTIMHISGEYMIQVEELLLNAEKEFLIEAKGYYQILKSLLTILLIYLLRIISETHTEVDKRLAGVIEYIDRNPFNLSIHEVASHYGYTEDYFSSIFKKNFGISFTEYINKKRINRAIELLITTNMTIENICESIGLSDKKNFYNIFKRHVGTTPGAFRKKSIR